MKKFLKLFSLFVAPFIILGCGSSDDDTPARKDHLADATYASEANLDKTGGYYAVTSKEGTADNASYTATVKNSGLKAGEAKNIEVNEIVFSDSKGGIITLSAYKGSGESSASVDVTVSLDPAPAAGEDNRRVKVQINGGDKTNLAETYKKNNMFTVSVDIDPSGDTAVVHVWNVTSNTKYTKDDAKVTSSEVTKGDGTGVTLKVQRPGTKVKALHIGEPKMPKKAATTSTTS